MKEEANETQWRQSMGDTTRSSLYYKLCLFFLFNAVYLYHILGEILETRNQV